MDEKKANEIMEHITDGDNLEIIREALEQYDDKIITIKVSGGCVYDVKGLPKGYMYEIHDEDLKH